MPADALKCKECQTTYPLEARFVCERCFGPLEVAYAPPSVDPAELRRRIQAGPHTLWRYADFLPAGGPGPLARCPRAGRRSCAPTGSRSGSASARSGSRTRPPTRRTPSRTASSRSRSPARSSSASTRSPAPRRATSPTPSRPTPPPPACPPTSSSRPTSRRRRSSPPAPTGRPWSRSRATTTTSTGSARELSGDRDGWAFVNVNMRPYYAEGSKTLAYEIAEQLGWELPDRVVAPIASGSLFTKIARGVRGVDRARAGRRASCRR